MAHMLVDRVAYLLFFFFNDTATTEIYTLSLHDALPIECPPPHAGSRARMRCAAHIRSEEHTSELQSRVDLVCRLLLEKKKEKKTSLHPEKRKTSRILVKAEGPGG